MAKSMPITLPDGRALATLASYIWRRFQRDECLRSAAALTYMSLFAVVPLMTVVYAMLSAVPAFAKVGDELQGFVFEHFLPSSAHEIEAYLVQFSAQARTLTGIGIAFLVVTALTMLTKIEKVFNAIWRIRENRSGLGSFLLYWAILSLGPLCLGLAIGISTYVASLRVIFDQVDVLGARALLFTAAPLLLTSAAFTLLFAAVPNCRVPLRHALIGGLVSGLCFELAKYLFALVMKNASYQLIYGTFAAIPLFLAWIYLSWIIVLAGAELVHALSGYDDRQIRQLPTLALALAVLERLWRKHQCGAVLSEREILRKRWLLGHYALSAERWATVRDLLIDGGLIKVSAHGDFVLGRDLHQYTLWDLCEHLGAVPAAMDNLPACEQPWLSASQRLLRELRASGRRQLQLPLVELFADNTAVSPGE
jgi:membrane protein